MAEMLWALLLFPSNVKAATKRRQVGEIWGLSGQQFAENHPLLRDDVLVGIGAGGLGFNIFKPNELEFLVELTCDLKRRSKSERRNILSNYDTFMAWIEAVLQKGKRQFRHMLRYFAFPDRVERMSSNNDRRKVLEGFSPASRQESGNWTDRQLDEALMALRAELQKVNPTAVLDFYEPPLRERWSREHRIETVAGPVTVTIPTEEDEVGDSEAIEKGMKSPEARESHQVQAKLAEIGAIIGFKIWIPRTDRARVQELMAKP
jgi:5-methylcytosine-specific restriction protein B